MRSDSLIRQSDCDRAVFDGATNSWYPMIELENFSSWNRDKRIAIVRPTDKADRIAALERALPDDKTATIPTSIRELEKTETEVDESTIEKPDLPDKEIYRLAMQLEEWISQHPEVERSKWYSNFNASRKGLSRPQFRYLLTLFED
ncbi:MAG: hypothetical protein MUF49_28495 [Oculatellaceae cyanobacterium Prado106]|jgi:hypothetical protein|nr:hypothetical protein [Oculatellaceae cyanobacterium Prado106]